ncbi:MAG TPA: CheR family methyltransferase [Actinoplanes sp.]|nr:CheR family methyltransferase [Actinoplanes sp.]
MAGCARAASVTGRPPDRPGSTGSHVARFRTLLAERMGWRFTDGDGPHLLAVLDRRCAAHGLSRSGYLARLDAGGWRAETAALTGDLTITETYFFRHAEQFRALAEVSLPDRVASRGDQRVLRMLSVGCSSGEEAYTLAFVARRVQPDPAWTVSVLGVDANPAMLRRAAGARYSTWSLRETPDDVRQRWFHRCDGGYEVHPDIRRTVRWMQDNVADDNDGLWCPDQYDVIFCRNLLMYLTPAVADRLVRRMTRSLVPGGYLFLGHTDSLGSRPDGLEPRHSHGTFYYRRPTAVTPAPAPRSARPPATDRPAPRPAGIAAYDQIVALLHQERFAEALAEVDRAGPAEPRDRLLRGMLLLQAGRLDQAEAAARDLIDADGLYADAHHLLGVRLEGGGATDRAAGRYRLAAYLDPAFALPRLRLGLIARRRGDDRAAAAELDRALHLLPGERDDRIVLFGGGFGRLALTTLCRAERDACGARR